MIIVIIAGGSGTRLWPLSMPTFPKHLLKINNDNRSLLQLTYDRAKKLTDKIYIVSEDGHINHVKDQLSELDKDSFIIESGRRGTANCIVSAIEYIGRNYGNDETIACIHADHYVRDVEGFYHSFKIADQIAKSEQRIVLVGVEPDYPATGFGYIEKGELLSEEPYVYNVASFKEKPDYQKAKEYLTKGSYLWNCGYFVGTLATFISSMEKYAPELFDNYQLLKNSSVDSYNKTYLSFESEAIDYALIEKIPNLLVIPASFDWMDLGSYSDLHKATGSDQSGNYIQGRVEIEGVENSFIENFEDKPVAVIGLDNVVVINTSNGILVARKDLSQKVGEVSKRIEK